jgi:transposase-like protein
MSNDTTVPLLNPAFRDEMTDLIRAHAQTAIRQAIAAELEAFPGEYDDTDGQGRRNVVRNGYQPERQVLTGVGPVSVQLPKTRDRAGRGRCFRSLVLPPYLKNTRRLEAVLPWLYLKGVSTNDFDEALRGLFGESVRGLSPATISRLKSVWSKGSATIFAH